MDRERKKYLKHVKMMLARNVSFSKVTKLVQCTFPTSNSKASALFNKACSSAGSELFGSFESKVVDASTVAAVPLSATEKGRAVMALLGATEKALTRLRVANSEIRESFIIVIQYK